MNKNRFKIFAALLGLIVVFTACQPEEYELGALMSKSDLKYSITQDPSNPNLVILESQTPGAAPLWQTPMGRSTKMKDEVKIPFAGKYAFVYGVTSAGGYVQADTFYLDITTNNLSYVDDPLWTLLTGGVGQEKTWVLDLNAEGVSKFFGGPLYFFGTEDSWTTVEMLKKEMSYDDIKKELGISDAWNWSPTYKGNEWLMSVGDYGTMTFSLKGNANVTVDHKMLGRTETGTFFLDAAAKTLKMTDAGPLHDSNRDKVVIDWGALKVLSLTENTLQLAALRDAALSGEGACLLVYNFISKEYSDNWVPADVPDPEPPYDGEANLDLTTDVSTTKTWKVDMDYPYNWHGLDGKPLNEVKTLGSDPAGFAFATWAPPYDATVFGSITVAFTKGGDADGSYVIKIGDTKFEGSYTVDENNNIDFGQPISFFTGVGGWLSFGTTAENTLRIIISEKDALGNIEGIWLGQRSTTKDEYLSLHLKPAATSTVVDPKDAVKKLISAKTWKIDSERTYDVTTSWGTEQGPVIFSDYATWSWNPKAGEHYASGEASVDYGTMKFETNGTVVVKQRKRTYTYAGEGGTTLTRNGSPQAGDVLATDETVTLNGTWDLDLEKNTISISVGMLHPWTCDFAVADWGAIKIYRIEENALLLQALRSKELSGEDEMPMTYIFVPAN